MSLLMACMSNTFNGSPPTFPKDYGSGFLQLVPWRVTEQGRVTLRLEILGMGLLYAFPALEYSIDRDYRELVFPRAIFTCFLHLRC